MADKKFKSKDHEPLTQKLANKVADATLTGVRSAKNVVDSAKGKMSAGALKGSKSSSKKLKKHEEKATEAEQQTSKQENPEQTQQDTRQTAEQYMEQCRQSILELHDKKNDYLNAQENFQLSKLLRDARNTMQQEYVDPEGSLLNEDLRHQNNKKALTNALNSLNKALEQSDDDFTKKSIANAIKPIQDIADGKIVFVRDKNNELVAEKAAKPTRQEELNYTEKVEQSGKKSITKEDPPSKKRVGSGTKPKSKTSSLLKKVEKIATQMHKDLKSKDKRESKKAEPKKNRQSGHAR